MTNMNFKTLEECIECYGRGNLVAIDNLKQIIFYTANGAQPKFVTENENKPGKISCWFIKAETTHIYKRWLEANPKKVD